MCPGAEMDVVAAEADELRDPQPGLDREQEEGMVAPTRGARPVRGREEGVHLVRRQERDEAPLEPLRRDGQDTLDVRGVLGMAKGGEPEQRTDRRQARVAGPDTVAPVVLEVVEERADQRGVKVGDVEPGRPCARTRRGRTRQTLAASVSVTRSGRHLADPSARREA